MILEDLLKEREEPDPNDPSNSLVDRYVELSIKNGYGDPRERLTNFQITQLIGKRAEELGYTAKTAGEQMGAPDFTDAYLDLKNQPDPNQSYFDDAVSGFKQAGYGLMGMAPAAAGLVAGKIGFEGAEEYLMDKAADITMKGMEDPTTIRSVSDVRWDRPSEAARWFMGAIGQAAPSVIESTGAFFAGGGAGYAIARQAGKKAIRETIENRLKGSTPKEAIDQLVAEATKISARQGFATGSKVGLGISSIGLGQGEIYSDLYRNTQLDPSDPDYVSPEDARNISLSFGTLSGSLDMLGASRLLSRLTGVGKDKAKNYLERVIRGLPEGIIIEGGTEVAQEFVNHTAKKFAKNEEHDWSDQEIAQLIDAGILGAIGGAQFTAIGAIPGPPAEKQDAPESIEPGDPTIERQQELLEETKSPAEKVFRYKKGDEVQTVNGRKGTVIDEQGITAVVQMENGDVEEISQSRLAAALEEIDIPEPEPEPIKETSEPSVQSKVTAEEIVPAEPEVTVPVVKVKSLDSKNEVEITEAEKKDIDLLIRNFKQWAKQDMHKSRGPVAKTKKGWASNDRARIELKLGANKNLWRGKRGDRNRAILAELGYLVGQNEWHEDTQADKDYIQSQVEELRKKRQAIIDDIAKSPDNWMGVGREAFDRFGQSLGTIEKHEDGWLIINGERVSPKDIYYQKPKRPTRRPVKKTQPSAQKTGTFGDDQNPETVPGAFPMDWEKKFAGKEIKIEYRTGTNKKAFLNIEPAQTTAELTENITKALSRAFNNKKFTTIRSEMKSILADGQIFGISQDSDSYSFGGIEIKLSDIEAYGKTPETSPTSIVQDRIGETFIIYVTPEKGGETAKSSGVQRTLFEENENGDITFLGTVDGHQEVAPSGNIDESNKNFLSLVQTNTRTRAVAIFKSKENGQIRLLKLFRTSSKQTGVLKVLDPTHKGRGKVGQGVTLAEMETEARGKWELIGKLATTKDLGRPFDIIYPDAESFRQDPKVVAAKESIGSDKAETESNARIRELEAQIEELEQQAKPKFEPEPEPAPEPEVTPEPEARGVEQDKQNIQAIYDIASNSLGTGKSAAEIQAEQIEAAKRLLDDWGYVIEEGETWESALDRVAENRAMGFEEEASKPAPEPADSKVLDLLKNRPVKYVSDIVEYEGDKNVAKGGYSGTEVLKEMAKNGSALNKALAKRLLGVKLFDKVRVGWADLDSESLSGEYKFQRKADPGGIWLTNKATEETVVHELMHALTQEKAVSYKKQGGKVVFKDKNMQDLHDAWDKASEGIDGYNGEITSDLRQSLTKFDEFLANLYSSSELQEYLKTLDGKSGKSLFAEILDILAEILNFNPKGRTLLEESLNALNAVVAEAGEIKTEPSEGLSKEQQVQLDAMKAELASEFDRVAQRQERQRKASATQAGDSLTGSVSLDEKKEGEEGQTEGREASNEQGEGAKEIGELETSTRKFKALTVKGGPDSQFMQLLMYLSGEGSFFPTTGDKKANALNRFAYLLKPIDRMSKEQMQEWFSPAGENVNHFDSFLEILYREAVRLKFVKPDGTGPGGRTPILSIENHATNQREGEVMNDMRSLVYRFMMANPEFASTLNFEVTKALDEQRGGPPVPEATPEPEQSDTSELAENNPIYQEIVSALQEADILQTVPANFADQLREDGVSLKKDGTVDIEGTVQNIIDLAAPEVNLSNEDLDNITLSLKSLASDDPNNFNLLGFLDPKWQEKSDKAKESWKQDQRNSGFWQDKGKDGSAIAYSKDSARLNRGGRKVDGMIDPSTGEIILEQTAPLDEISIEESLKTARNDRRSYMADKENPLIAIRGEGAVTEGQAAMSRFAPIGGEPFSSSTALNQIIRRFPTLEPVSSIVRLLQGSKHLESITIEFLPWDQFRKYIPAGKAWNAAYNSTKKRIYISDAFYDRGELSADEILASKIAHELLHPVLNEVLEIGYDAKNNIVDTRIPDVTRQEVLQIFNTVENLLPMLRELAVDKPDMYYGLSSIDEFFATFASDPVFRQFLGSVNMPKAPAAKKGFVQTVLDFLYRVLAKLNFAKQVSIAPDQSVMDFAHEKILELVDMSQAVPRANPISSSEIYEAGGAKQSTRERVIMGAQLSQSELEKVGKYINQPGSYIERDRFGAIPSTRRLADSLIFPDGQVLEAYGASHAVTALQWIKKNKKNPFAKKVIKALGKDGKDFDANSALDELMDLGVVRFVTHFDKQYLETRGQPLTQAQLTVAEHSAVSKDEDLLLDVVTSDRSRRAKFGGKMGEPKVLYKGGRERTFMGSEMAGGKIPRRSALKGLGALLGGLTALPKIAASQAATASTGAGLKELGSIIKASLKASRPNSAPDHYSLQLIWDVNTNWGSDETESRANESGIEKHQRGLADIYQSVLELTDDKLDQINSDLRKELNRRGMDEDRIKYHLRQVSQKLVNKLRQQVFSKLDLGTKSTRGYEADYLVKEGDTLKYRIPASDNIAIARADVEAGRAFDVNSYATIEIEAAFTNNELNSVGEKLLNKHAKQIIESAKDYVNYDWTGHRARVAEDAREWERKWNKELQEPLEEIDTSKILNEESPSVGRELEEKPALNEEERTHLEQKKLDKPYNKNDKILFYDEVLDEISRTATPGSEEHTIIRAINNLRTGQGDSGQGIRIAKTATVSQSDGREALERFAKESGKEVDAAQVEEKLDWGEYPSGEHRVYFDEATQEFVKILRPSYNSQGERKLMRDPQVVLSEYLERILIHNYFFPMVKYTLEGFMPTTLQPSGTRGSGPGMPSNGDAPILTPVLRQKAVDGSNPSQQVIDDYMIGLGFRVLKPPAREVEIRNALEDSTRGFGPRYYARGDIVIGDLNGKNARVFNGNFFPFDPQIYIGSKPRIEKLEFDAEKAINEGELELILNEIQNIRDRSEIDDIQGSEIANSSNPSPGGMQANPDDNARVMMEANAAGFNELVEELVKVYREVGATLGIPLEDFLDIYGSPGKKISTIKKLLDRDLAPFMDSSEDLRIGDAGLNRIARNWGTRKAVANLEIVREKARKQFAALKLLEENAEADILKSLHLYEDLKKGRFPPVEKQVEALLSKVHKAGLEKLTDYAKALPGSQMTQADIKTLKMVTKEDMDRIMDAIINMPGEVETGTKQEVMDAIESLNIDSLSGSSVPAKLKKLAIMYSIRESKGQLALYRLSKGKIGGSQQEIMRTASRISRATDLSALEKIAIESGVKGTPLRHFARLKKAELEARREIEANTDRQNAYNQINDMLKVRSDRLRAALGELEPVNIYDGATILTMKMDEKGEWIRDKFQVRIKNGKIDKRAEFVKANVSTLRFVRDAKMVEKYGNEPWFDIMREQALLAMAEPVADEYFHVQRATWMTGLQGLTERFSKLGYEGNRLSQMSSRTVALFRDYASKSQALSKLFDTSAHKVMSSLKISGREFYSGIYQDIFWWFDNHPEHAGNEEQAFAELWKHLKKTANIPDRALLNNDSKRHVREMISRTLEARNFENEVNRKLGNRIKDDDFKVESYLDGQMVDFYRSPLDIGFSTLPRSINDSMVIDTTEIMLENGWRGETGNGLIAESASVDMAQMEKIYSALFTEEVVRRFVKPYTNTDVRQSMFRGPKDADGHSPYIGNSFVNEAFMATNGNIFDMTDYIYDRLAEDQTEESRLLWKHSFLRQMDNRFGQLKKVSDDITMRQVEQGLHDSKNMRNTPQSLDNRMMESRLPKEFFYYTMYDEVTSNIRLALITATATFGRQGDTAQSAFTESKAVLNKARKRFNRIMQVATKGKHDEPRKHYTREEKREAYRILRAEGESNAEKTWNDLYAKSAALGELNVAMSHLARYYGKDNEAGPYKDANLLLELLGVQSLAVLNNPKSSFWQNLALFEFPMAFRGLNKMAGKATAASLANFVDQTFGGILESIGMELPKTGRYAQYLNNTHFRMDEMDLSFKDYVMNQVGSGGDLAGHDPKKYIRMVKLAAMHNKRKNVDGTRAPFDWLTVIKGIFPYMNNVVNHSVGVGAMHAYGDLVIQASEEIARRGMTEYKELTAEDLGLGDKMGEWIIGEKDGYTRMNQLLISHGLPSVTRLAMDFLDRKKADKNALPIERNMGLLINTIAMDQISGDGFNAKPAWLYSNQYLRYVNTFLGWPLGKMGRDLQAIIRDPSDELNSYKALMKYIGLLSAVYMPMGLSFAMLIDWYDDEMLGKPNNLPPMSPWAALPIVGLPIAASDPNFTAYAITSRMAKAGVPMGMGMDVLNGIFAKGDPYGSAREISLDSRIFAWSMFKNIYDAMGTWMHQGEFDWATVGRPIAYGVGGNSVIQMMDLTTETLDIDTEERRVADYIGLKNTIKKTAFMLGYELRPPFKGGGRPTGVSVNTRQMLRAAYAGDNESFLRDYQQAIEEAKDAASVINGQQTAEEYVINSFKDRSPRTGVTKTVMSDAQWNTLLEVLDPEDRQKVVEAEQAHAFFLRLIGGTPRRERAPSFMSTDLARERVIQMIYGQ